MDNNRNSNQTNTGRQQTMEPSTSRSGVSQKNMETLRVLSNIRIPNVGPLSNQWNCNNAQNIGYFTDEFKNNCEQINIQEGSIQGQSTFPEDIVNSALSSAINEESHRNVLEELTNISVPESLLQALSSPWDVEDCTNDVKWTSTSNTIKEKPTTKKSRRRSLNIQGPSKKQKTKDVSSQLKKLLLKCENNKENVATTSISNVDAETVIILSDGSGDNQENHEIFSQDADMAIFKKAIDLKKTLMENKETAERDVVDCENEVIRIKDKIASLNNELSKAEEQLEKTRRQRDILKKKVDWIQKSL